jgi:hypothetical protein
MDELSYSPSPGNDVDLVAHNEAATDAGAVTSAARFATQLCQHCGHALSARSRGKAGRTKRFCSPACRVAFSREKLLRNASRYNDPACYEIASKTLNNSKGCGAKNRHPYPPRLSVPLDILGRGCRWPGSRRLDGSTWATIVRREVGAAP